MATLRHRGMAGRAGVSLWSWIQFHLYPYQPLTLQEAPNTASCVRGLQTALHVRVAECPPAAVSWPSGASFAQPRGGAGPGFMPVLVSQVKA